MAARGNLLIDRVVGFFNYFATDSVCDISETDLTDKTSLPE